MYRLYIDEVGHDNPNTANDPRERYLCLMGIIIELETCHRHLHDRMTALKQSVFSTAQVVLHRREIIDKKPPPFDVLRDPVKREMFDEGLISLMAECDYSAIAVFIDKKEHLDTYKVWTAHPYHYCLKAMMERYVMHLADLGQTGDVMAEWRGIKPNRKLEAAYQYLYKRGTENMTALRFQRQLSSSQLKIRKKEANDAGLQLADILANPAYRYLRCRKDNEEMTAPYGKRVVRILQEQKFRRNLQGKIDGFGIKMLP